REQLLIPDYAEKPQDFTRLSQDVEIKNLFFTREVKTHTRLLTPEPARHSPEAKPMADGPARYSALAGGHSNSGQVLEYPPRT
ncbi:MAG: hypothetical protein AMJ45_04145, partial [Syntrophobacter sp. DG_60]